MARAESSEQLHQRFTRHAPVSLPAPHPRPGADGV